jgi:hypothetical protein
MENGSIDFLKNGLTGVQPYLPRNEQQNPRIGEHYTLIYAKKGKILKKG